MSENTNIDKIPSVSGGGGGTSGGGTWGSITGTLSAQTDLSTALAAKVAGPASATDAHLAVFDGATGKLVKDGGAVPSGNVVGPASVTDAHIAQFDGATGKLLKDGGVLGTAAALTAGTAANNIVQLDANAKLPAVDGSQLTNVPASAFITSLSVAYAYNYL